MEALSGYVLKPTVIFFVLFVDAVIRLLVS